MSTKKVIGFVAGVFFFGLFCWITAAPGHARMPSEVVFIDPSVRDAATIEAQLPQGAEVVRLSPAMDGVAQISAHLAGKEDLSAMRIISHGNSGHFVLNGKRIDGDFLRGHGDRISAWGRALAENGDILLYACNLAATDEGKAFVEHLVDLTGADVAASTDVTGEYQTSEQCLITDNCLLTTVPDWRLEYACGLIESHTLNIQGYPHHLATYTVTSPTDTGSDTETLGKLSWAITQSNASTTVDDTIAFNLTSGSTVTISGALPTISDSVTIDGDDDGTNVTVKVTIPGSASYAYRIFNINADGETVNISNMTIQGGDISSADNPDNLGGGIYIAAGTVELDSVIVSDSKASTGGGIYNNDTLSITNSTINNNIAGNGGGIYNATGKTLTITNSTLKDNSTDWRDGGGIYNSGILNVVNSTIYNNTSARIGGGICNNGTLNLINSTVAGNTATSSGGGIDNYTGGKFIYILNSVIVDNTAGTGADINNPWGTVNPYYSWYDGTNGTIGGSNNNDTEAYASGDLGSLGYNGGFTDTSAVSSAGNASNKAGSGTYAYYNSTDGYSYYNGSNYIKISDGNTATNTTADDQIQTDQRGYYRTTGAVTRGAYQYNGVVAKIGDDTSWTAGDIGTNTFTTIEGAYNEANDDDIIELAGTAIYESGITLNADKTVTIRRDDALSTTTYVQADETAGTASDRVFDITDGDVTLEDINIRYGNIDSTNGGGINNAATLTLNNSTLCHNRAYSTAGTSQLGGGGIYNNGTLTINNSTLSGNTISNITSGSLNSYAKGGGGCNSGTLTMNNSTVFDNTASATVDGTGGSNGWGGGLYTDGATAVIINSTISGNSISATSSGPTTELGAGICLSGGNATVQNSIIAQNTDNATHYDYYYYYFGALTDGGYNLVEIQGGSSTGEGKTFTAGTDLIGQDPQLGNLGYYGGNTQTLPLCKAADGTTDGCNNATSPAIDEIPPGGQCGGSVPYNVDQRGIARPNSTNCDIGAYERTGPLLVDLVSFTAEGFEEYVLLTWETASEIDNAGFHLWRSEKKSSKYEIITDSFIWPEGGLTWGAKYEYEDIYVEPGLTYFYELEDIDDSGVSTFHGPVSATMSEAAISLESPEIGTSFSPSDSPPTFRWEGAEELVRFKLQFSTDPTFKENVIELPPDEKKVDVWIKEEYYILSQKEWRKVSHLGRKGQIVYWRVYGEGEEAEGYTSEVFEFTSASILKNS